MNSFTAFMDTNKAAVEKRIARLLKGHTFGKDPIMNRMTEVIEEFCLRDGKRIRPLLALLGYDLFLGEDKDSMLTVASALELLHAFLLIHDDIMDLSDKRRGKKTVHKIYEEHYKGTELDGEHMAMLSGDTLCFIAYKALFTTSFDDAKKCRTLEMVNEILVQTCHGQALDYEMQAYPILKERIMEMYKLKTSIYTISGPLEIGAMLAGAGNDDRKVLQRFALPLGIAFQIQDDLLDAFPTGADTGKARYGDLKEGKHTILAYHVLEHAQGPDKRFLEKHLGDEKLTDAQGDKICRIMEVAGSKDYALDLIRELSGQAREAISSSDLDTEKKERLLDLLEYVMKRKK